MTLILRLPNCSLLWFLSGQLSTVLLTRTLESEICVQVRRVQVNSTEAVYKWPCGYIKTIKKTNKSKGCIKNKSASLDDVQMQF